MLVKLFSHLDTGLHVYFAIRLGLMLPLYVIAPVLLATFIVRRELFFGLLVVDRWYNALVYSAHAIAAALCLVVR